MGKAMTHIDGCRCAPCYDTMEREITTIRAQVARLKGDVGRLKQKNQTIGEVQAELTIDRDGFRKRAEAAEAKCGRLERERDQDNIDHSKTLIRAEAAEAKCERVRITVSGDNAIRYAHAVDGLAALMEDVRAALAEDGGGDE